MNRLIKLLFIILIFAGVFELTFLNFPWHRLIYQQTSFNVYQNPVLDQQRSDLLNYFKSGTIKVYNSPNFNSLELGHIQDIKTLLVIWQWIFLSLVFVSTLIYVLKSLKLKDIKLIALIGVGLTVLLAISSILLFSKVFEVFHRIFFPQGNWHFDPQTDLIIRLYPPEFIFWYWIYYLLIVLLFFSFLYFVSLVIQKNRPH